MPTHVLRGLHVGFVLFLCFLLYPVAQRFRHRVRWWDWLAALASLAVIGYMLAGGDDFLERAIAPNLVDEILTRLSPQNYELAVSLASVPEYIRGYGHVKERHLKDAKAREAALLARLRDGAPQAAATAKVPVAAD